MNRHVPAANKAAIATRLSTTPNPGRALEGRERLNATGSEADDHSVTGSSMSVSLDWYSISERERGDGATPICAQHATSPATVSATSGLGWRTSSATFDSQPTRRSRSPGLGAGRRVWIK